MNLVPFEFNGHQIRVVIDEITNTEWFIGADVAKVLDYSDTEAMTRRLDDDEKQNRQIVGFGNRGISTINESGLYNAIFGSTKEFAKEFRKWVTSEVLPQIRRTGSFSGNQPKEISYYPEKVKTEMILVESLSSMLRMDDNSKLMLAHNVAKVNNINSAILPQYTENTRVHHSATHLLKELDAGMSTLSFNKKLHELGYIEKKQRLGRDSSIKTFWSITEKGESFGLNQTSPQNKNETQPHWYDDSFSELLSDVISKSVS